MSHFLIHQPELLIASVPRDLDDEHRCLLPLTYACAIWRPLVLVLGTTIARCVYWGAATKNSQLRTLHKTFRINGRNSVRPRRMRKTIKKIVKRSPPRSE